MFRKGPNRLVRLDVILEKNSRCSDWRLVNTSVERRAGTEAYSLQGSQRFKSKPPRSQKVDFLNQFRQVFPYSEQDVARSLMPREHLLRIEKLTACIISKK